MSIYKYLMAIKQGKHFNAVRAKTLFHKNEIDFESLGKLTHVKGDNYKLKPVDHDVIETLIQRFKCATSRIDASLKGDSHLFRTSVAYLFAKYIDSHNDEILAIGCKGDSIVPFRLNSLSISTAVLIENSECFTYSISFLKTLGLKSLPRNTIIIWSSGKAITHPNAIKYLRSFDTLHYCPDYDLVGLEIYETLKKSLGNKLQFVIPPNLLAYADYCEKPEDPMDFIRALEKAKAHKFESLAHLFENSYGFLEQEILLGDKNEY
ncbi:hypothetical protein O1B25_002813 [Vibrio cholerae]|nr:hypothetical protein [Vibrio cholerae]